MGVYIARATGRPSPSRSAVAHLAADCLEVLQRENGGHPVYSAPAFRQYLHDPPEMAGMEVEMEGANGSISGVIFREDPQGIRAGQIDSNRVFIPLDADHDTDADMIFQKHE